MLARPPVLLATVVGFLLIGSCAAVEAGVVATFGDGSPPSRHRARHLVARLARRRSRARPPARRTVGDRAPHADRLRRRRARDLRLRRLVPVGHAHHRRPRHRPGPRGDVHDRLGEREVQRHRRGLRLGGHRPADRRGHWAPRSPDSSSTRTGRSAAFWAAAVLRPGRLPGPDPLPPGAARTCAAATPARFPTPSRSPSSPARRPARPRVRRRAPLRRSPPASHRLPSGSDPGRRAGCRPAPRGSTRTTGTSSSHAGNRRGCG